MSKISSITIKGVSYDVVDDTSGYVTRMVNDLQNYYLKNEVDERLSAIPKFAITVVSELPTENISPSTVYLLKTGDDTDNLYTEFIYTNNKWEQLGTQKVDLTPYARVEDVNRELATKATKTELSDLSDVVDTKAKQSDMTNVQKDVASLQTTMATKAAQSDMDTAQQDIAMLQSTVAQKAEQRDLQTLQQQVSDVQIAVNTKAEQATVNNLAQTVSEKANASDVSALQSTVAGKADKATSLSGYGIKDAYTRTEMDTKLQDYALKGDDTGKVDPTKVMDLSSIQTASGAKTFTDLATFNSGATFMGTAEAAGLKTRGVSGLSPDGATKDHLYLNYDGEGSQEYARKVYLGGTSDGAVAVRQDMLDNALKAYYTKTDLDTALANKASTADVAALQTAVNNKADTTALDNYVALTGNQVINGEKSFNSLIRAQYGLIGGQNTSSWKEMALAGDTADGFGAILALRNSVSASNAGTFALLTRLSNGNVPIALEGFPDARLLWGGRNIVRSVNGATADNGGNVSLNVSALPPGTVISYLGKSVPSGFLLCNGATIQRSQYPNLVPILGNLPNFRGDGSTTLVLPNLMARFIEYTTDTNQVGNYIEAGLPNITGGLTSKDFELFVDDYPNIQSSGALRVEQMTRNNSLPGSSSTTLVGGITLDASMSNALYGKASTVQTASIFAMPLIKI